MLDLPASFQREAAGFSISTMWLAKKGMLTCESKMAATQAVIHPREHRSLFELAQELETWLNSPAILKRPSTAPKRSAQEDSDGESADEPKRWTPKPETLPRLITAQGQLALVDLRYPLDPQNPFDADHKSRRKALTKVLEYFPDDPHAQFQAGVVMLAGELMEFEFDNIAEKANALIAKYRATLDANSLAAGELILGAGLALKGKDEEAKPLLLAIADNGELNPAIRTPAAYLAGMIVEEKDPERAVGLARQALEVRSLPLDVALGAAALDIMSLARLEKTQAAELVGEMESILRRHALYGDALRETLMSLPDGIFDAGYWPACEKVVPALEEMGKARVFDEDSLEAVKAARESLTKAQGIVPLREKVLAVADRPSLAGDG